MKILHVYGDEHSAMYVDDVFGLEKAYKLAKENGGKCIIDEDDGYAEVKVLEFGNVDEKFVSFINNNFIDYDRAKDEDFFVMEL